MLCSVLNHHRHPHQSIFQSAYGDLEYIETGNENLNESFELLTVMKIQIEVFWVVTPCSDVVRCQRFGGPCCLHLQGEDNMQ